MNKQVAAVKPLDHSELGRDKKKANRTRTKEKKVRRREGWLKRQKRETINREVERTV